MQEIQEPLLVEKLLYYINLLEAGCPVERHELTNEEWLLIGAVKAEVQKIALEKARTENGKHGQQ